METAQSMGWSLIKRQNAPIFSVRLLAAWILGISLLCVNGVTAADEWEFSTEVYGWLPDIDIETESGGEVEIGIEDILDNLDLTLMLAGAARKGKWTIGADMVWMDLDHNKDESLTPLLTVTDMEMRSFIFTPMVGYRVYQTERHYLELLAGARLLWMDTDLSIELTLPGRLPDKSQDISAKESFWDAIVGIHGSYRLSDRWTVPYYLSAGAGETDFTGQANAAFAYEFEKFDTVIGWRYMTWTLGGALDELTINGPFVGAKFRF